MKLLPVLEAALDRLKFVTPTPIQAQAIPVALTNRDVLGCAQTGSGKTVAFCIPILTRLLKLPQKSALVLAPTRELAMQIQEVLNQLTDSTQKDLKPVLLIGGNSMQTQVRALQRRPRIVVATPGRLCDHLRRGTLSLFSVEVLVLDEADRMLDMGFAPQLNEILRFIPKSRQTLLFSATLPDNILKLAMKYQKDPVRVTVSVASQAAPKITQTVVNTTEKGKNDVLLDQLNARQGAVLIFARTKRRTDRVAKYLLEYGHKVARIHGDRSQGQRNDAIRGFRDGSYRILVATDIAARGLDIPVIAHVINYDLPQQPEDYIHRIGRTARAGASGEALCLLVPEDRLQWKAILKQFKAGTKIEGDVPHSESADPRKPAPHGTRPPHRSGQRRDDRRPASRPSRPHVFGKRAHPGRGHAKGTLRATR